MAARTPPEPPAATKGNAKPDAEKTTEAVVAALHEALAALAHALELLDASV